MKPEAQRIAIAKACGYINPRELNPGIFVASCGLDSQGEYWGTRGIPDYLGDLNDMHEAENMLSSLQWVAYGRCIQSACDATRTWPVHATAAQRARAFLKTLNLWTDDN